METHHSLHSLHAIYKEILVTHLTSNSEEWVKNKPFLFVQFMFGNTFAVTLILKQKKYWHISWLKSSALCLDTNAGTMLPIHLHQRYYATNSSSLEIRFVAVKQLLVYLPTICLSPIRKKDFTVAITIPLCQVLYFPQSSHMVIPDTLLPVWRVWQL